VAAFDIRAALAASALIYCLPGCDAAPIESESTLGTLSMPLATEVNGVRYRLTEDRFTISGETIEQELQHNGDGSIVIATLPEGDYEVTLHDGWVLERENDSEFEPIVAELVSPNPRPVRIDSDQTTTVAWLFQTDGTPVGLEPPGLFQGNLAVADSTNPVPQIVGDVLVTEPVHIEALAGIARIEGSLSIQGGMPRQPGRHQRRAHHHEQREPADLCGRGADGSARYSARRHADLGQRRRRRLSLSGSAFSRARATPARR
jgi:hypothetical protein